MIFLAIRMLRWEMDEPHLKPKIWTDKWKLEWRHFKIRQSMSDKFQPVTDTWPVSRVKIRYFSCDFRYLNSKFEKKNVLLNKHNFLNENYLKTRARLFLYGFVRLIHFTLTQFFVQIGTYLLPKSLIWVKKEGGTLSWFNRRSWIFLQKNCFSGMTNMDVHWSLN